MYMSIAFYRILYAAIVEVRQEFGDFVALYVFDFFLVMLLVLHIKWTSMIYKLVVRNITKGEEVCGVCIHKYSFCYVSSGRSIPNRFIPTISNRLQKLPCQMLEI